MNIVVKYSEENEKITAKIDDESPVEIAFSMLINITNKVIDDGVNLTVTTEGFEKAPDLEQNYKKIFEDIQKLKVEQEIVDLKSKIATATNQDNTEKSIDTE